MNSKNTDGKLILNFFKGDDNISYPSWLIRDGNDLYAEHPSGSLVHLLLMSPEHLGRQYIRVKVNTVISCEYTVEFGGIAMDSAAIAVLDQVRHICFPTLLSLISEETTSWDTKYNQMQLIKNGVEYNQSHTIHPRTHEMIWTQKFMSSRYSDHVTLVRKYEGNELKHVSLNETYPKCNILKQRSIVASTLIQRLAMWTRSEGDK